MEIFAEAAKKQESHNGNNGLETPWIPSTGGSRPMYRSAIDVDKDWWWTAPKARVI